MFFPVVLGSPDSPLSVTLSLIPFFTPMLMFLRITAVTPPTWQIALSLVLTLATVVVVTWAAVADLPGGHPHVRQAADVPRDAAMGQGIEPLVAGDHFG